MLAFLNWLVLFKLHNAVSVTSYACTGKERAPIKVVHG